MADIAAWARLKPRFCEVEADTLALTGKVILPAFTFIASTQSSSWYGLEPVLCEIDPVTQQMDAGQAAALIDPSVSGILGVKLWGGACNQAGLEQIHADLP